MKARKKHRSPRRPAAATTAPPVAAANEQAVVLPAHGWLLALLAALLVARPLVPSEAVAWLGDGQPFCMLWLLLAGGTALAACKAGGLPRRLDAVDLLLVAFALLHTLAAWLSADTNPRPALNMLWEVVAMAVSFLLVRQLVATREQARTLVAVMLALAVVMSAYGLYQVFIGLPADRAQYAVDPEGLLRDAGQWYPPGSPERMAFENRLNSTEPLATFALTNSLAGFLVGWLIVAVGLSFSRLPRSVRITLIVALAAIGFCLLLTKSRSALGAGLVGIAALSLGSTMVRRQWKWSLGAAVAAVVAVVVALAAGKLDREMITEAGKSLGYRLQYWQSTSRMIADHPLFGVGAGNFQDYYTQYKLPEASEEIRDPHNWAFELAATAGVPALLMFGAFLLLAFWQILSRHETAADEPSSDDPPVTLDLFPLVGAGFGFLLALIAGPLAGLPLGMEKVLGGLLVGGSVVALLRPWILTGRLAPQLLALAAAVMLINLLAAGGILYPGVASSLWLLLALGLNLAVPPVAFRNRWAPVVALAAAALLGLGQYWTGYSPVLNAQGLLMQAQNAAIPNRETDLLAAAAADPRASEPWMNLANWRLQLWLERPNRRSLEQFSEACREYLRRRPQSSSALRQVGNWWWQVFEKTQDVQHAAAAEQYLSRAGHLYPNQVSLRAELARTLTAQGKTNEARAEAQRALALDAATPHADKKLSEPTRREMAEIAGPQSQGSR